MLRGNLADFNLLDLFQLVRATRKSGALTLERSTEQVVLYFTAGRLARAKDASQGSLAQALLRGGRISSSDYDLLSPEVLSVEKSSALALVGAGVLSQEDIVAFVEEETRKQVLRVLVWTEGTFSYDPDLAPAEDDITIDLDLGPFIDEGRRRVEEWQQLRAAIPSLDAVVMLRPHPRVRLPEITLSHREWQLAASVGGGRRLVDLAELLSMDEFEIRQVARGLEARGLIELAQPSTLAASEPTATASNVALEDERPAEPEGSPPPAAPARRGFFPRLFG